VQLAATQGSFASSNLEAVHQYGLGMEEQFAGKMQDALQSFTKATELDPNFARAYSGMAAASRNLGQRQDAENYIKVAMQHTDRMTERERFRLRGTYYILTSDWKKCIDEYSSLIKQYPVDNIGHGNLAYCYSNVPDMVNAVKEQRIAVELSPNSSAQRMNLSVYATYAGDFQTSEEQAHAVLKMNSAYEKGYLALAYAQMGQDHMDQAGETYRLLDKVSTLGKSYATAGLSDLDIYQGQFAAAAKMLEAGAAADLEAKRPDLAAAKFSALADVNLMRNQKAQALAAITKALANGKGGKLQFLAARLYVAAGEVAKARDLAAGLASAVSPESQAYGKLIQGELALLDKKPSDAVKTFTEASNLADSWIGHFDLGRAYIDAGLFVEADSEFDACVKRRGEAMELFMGDMPTFSYFAPVYYFQGRAREGLKTASFKESYQTYLNIRGKAGEDPLLPEIRKRLAQ
jgi:Tfp pilus assembly protein PilF